MADSGSKLTSAHAQHASNVETAEQVIRGRSLELTGECYGA